MVQSGKPEAEYYVLPELAQQLRLQCFLPWCAQRLPHSLHLPVLWPNHSILPKRLRQTTSWHHPTRIVQEWHMYIYIYTNQNRLIDIRLRDVGGKLKMLWHILKQQLSPRAKAFVPGHWHLRQVLLTNWIACEVLPTATMLIGSVANKQALHDWQDNFRSPCFLSLSGAVVT